MGKVIEDWKPVPKDDPMFKEGPRLVAINYFENSTTDNRGELIAVCEVIELPLSPTQEAEYAAAKYRRRDKCVCGHEHWQHKQDKDGSHCKFETCGCSRFTDPKCIRVVSKDCSFERGPGI